MAIDFAVDLPCPVKTSAPAPTDRLMEWVKLGRQAEASYRSLSPDRSVDDVTVVISRSGSEPIRMPLKKLLAVAGLLETWKAPCLTCPADRQTGGYGCIGHIPYPIEEATERWLLEALPTDLRSGAGAFLEHAVDELPSPSCARRLRAGGGFFERSRPDERRWEGGFRIDADQVFDLLIGRETLEPAQSFILCAIFGRLAGSPDEPTLARGLYDPNSRKTLAATAASPPVPPTDQAALVDSYLDALLAAVRLDVPVRVSY